jgi:hypothetical protein
MSRTLQGSVLALLILAASSGSARADWWGYSSCSASYYYPAYYYTGYYYPAVTPVYYVVQPPKYPCPTPIVRPAIGNGFYAQPQAAPPSQGNEAPQEKKKPGPPKVTESQALSISDAKVTPLAVDGNANADCRVGFWNVSGRDVKLTVSGKTYHVGRDRNLTLTLNRTFSWGIDGNEPQADRVPEERNSHEIVIR